MTTITLEAIKATQDKLASMIAAPQAPQATPTAEPTVFTALSIKVTLQPGELYVGLVLDAVTGQPSHHLVLLSGDDGNMTWQAANEWATAHGGYLPTRQEQALLFANLKREFQSAWYWSGEQGSASAAWVQSFDSGGQSYGYYSDELRVRAVRRLHP
jgi:hypothetical protein